MFTNLLLAVDGSEASQLAARHGMALAKALDARVTLATVTVPWSAHFARELAVVVPDVVVPQSQYDARRETIAASLLQGLAGDARSAGIAVKTIHRSHREPYQALLDVAIEETCDLIVMGCHHAAGLTGALIGSESMKLIAHSKMPVLVCRSRTDAPPGSSDRSTLMYKHILIATDGSDLAAKAVAQGLALAKSLGARVTALSATDPWTAFPVAEAPALQFPVEEYQKLARQSTERILSQVRDKAQSLGVECATVPASKYPADAIIETAQSEGCDLIVMASHGRRGIARALLGSQAARVVTLSSIPVLICR